MKQSLSYFPHRERHLPRQIGRVDRFEQSKYPPSTLPSHLFAWLEDSEKRQMKKSRIQILSLPFLSIASLNLFGKSPSSPCYLDSIFSPWCQNENNNQFSHLSIYFPRISLYHRVYGIPSCPILTESKTDLVSKPPILFFKLLSSLFSSLTSFLLLRISYLVFRTAADILLRRFSFFLVIVSHSLQVVQAQSQPSLKSTIIKGIRHTFHTEQLKSKGKATS